MANTLAFYGAGTRMPGRTDQEALFDWAHELFRKLNSGSLPFKSS